MKASAGSAAAARTSSSAERSVPAAKTAAAKPATKTETASVTETAVKKPQPAAKASQAAKPETKSAPLPEPAAEPAPARPGFSAQPQAAAPTPPPAMMNDRRPPDRGPAPRAHAKQETFVEGDHVVYPTHGVGKVERIATEEIAGHKLELIHITFEENRMTLRVPVTKAPAAGLRKLATRKMFDEALAVLKGRARIKRTMWSRRAQEYEAKINSGDPLAIAEVVRDLHRNAGQPDQSFSERQIYEAAMDRLAAELAALDKTDKATASEKLTNFLKTIA
jgi:CarD family transcriptional regulator